MITIGKYNKLKIARKSDFGFYLEDEEGDEVLLPNQYITPEMQIGEELRVFVYNDSEDRIVATTQDPKVTTGEFAYLEVIEINNLGAFMDIGLPKDLLIPFNNQGQKMHEGRSYLVYVYLDELTERLVGTDKIRKFLSLEPTDLKVGDEVDLLIGDKVDLGYFTIVNNRYHGLVYDNEVYDQVYSGQKRKGYVRNIREDGKIDISLEKPGYSKVEPNAQKLLDYLKENEGYMTFTDKSDPELIKRQFQMSKKTFKKALGALYKARIVKLEKKGVRLV